MAFPLLFASGDDLIAHALEEPKESKIWHFFEHGGLFEHGLQLNLPGGEFFAVTKFKILILAAAIIVFFLFNRLANRLTSQGHPKGRLDNLLESLLLLVRQQISRTNFFPLYTNIERFLNRNIYFLFRKNLLKNRCLQIGREK